MLKSIKTLILSIILLNTASAEELFVNNQERATLAPASIQLPNFSELVKSLSPSVVNISVDGGAEDDSTAEADNNSPAPKKDPELPFRSVGSGFIVNENGYIVTNFHVVGNAADVTVRLLNDKTEYHATVIGKDQKTDLALIKITPKGKLKPVIIGDSDKLEVGEWVLAIGNQFQLGQTVTVGIVSAKSRKVPTKGGPYDSYIQTDASINPGSSGGPLFNAKGEVVGINSAIFSPGRPQGGGSGFNIGIGFSIPINQAKSVLEQLKGSGKVVRGMLGVIIQPIDNDIAEVLGLDSQDGALVADVNPGTPAARAGFKRRDVIVSFDGHKIKDYDDLPMLVASTPIGTKVEIGIIRAGKSQSLSASIDVLKDKVVALEERDKPNNLGLMLQLVTPDLAKSLGLSTNSGLLIIAVEGGSVAEKSGLLRGDIIEDINGLPLNDIDTFDKVVNGLQKGKPSIIAVRRKEGTRLLVLKIK